MDMHTPLDGARNSRLGLWRLRVFKIEFEECGRSFSEFWRKEIGKKNILMLECLQVKTESRSLHSFLPMPRIASNYRCMPNRL